MKEKKILMVPYFNPILFDMIEKYLSKELEELINIEKSKTVNTPKTSIPMCVDYYIAVLAKKVGWDTVKMANYLQVLWDIKPFAAFCVLLREIAIELDKKYEDHINNCKEVFIISSMDGRIHKVSRGCIKNFRNFAAFRTEEDAKIACRILRKELKEMFKSDGK